MSQADDGLQAQVGAVHQVQPSADAVHRSQELGGEPVGLHLARRAARGAEDDTLEVDRPAVPHLDVAELLRQREALPGDCLRAVEEDGIPAPQARDAWGQSQDRHRPMASIWSIASMRAE